MISVPSVDTKPKNFHKKEVDLKNWIYTLVILTRQFAVTLNMFLTLAHKT